ncbi:hypothetical protein H2199_008825 [Coniosporium tulheliwenetii]|uniref:Uncharacterized protein n=1 Tax=Coniosporium tulheliwenetii TaxID=3383036 RepID=A0ACC2YHF4_9PEZI|nr:hypothetical protein H2199_008825 [Cladosporium sp. JES 115]
MRGRADSVKAKTPSRRRGKANSAKIKTPLRYRGKCLLVCYEELLGTSIHHQTVIEVIRKAGKSQAVEIKVFRQTNRHTYYFLAEHPTRFQSSFKSLRRLIGGTPHIEVAPKYDELCGKLPSDTELELLHNDFCRSADESQPSAAQGARARQAGAMSLASRAAPTVAQPDSMQPLLADFLSTSNALLQPLANAFAEAIRTAGLSSLEHVPSPPSPLSEQSATAYPVLFPTLQCWHGIPSFDDILNQMLYSASSDTKVFARGNPYELSGCTSKVVKQLWRPDASTTYYAVDLKCPMTKMRIPEALLTLLHVYYPQNGELSCMGNITPEFSFVDLHIDNGQDVLTTVVGDAEDCVKLWALYPPESHNLDLYYSHAGQDSKFLNLYSRLKDGIFVVQTSEQTIYLPAGWIHAVYTLKGGLVPGTMWSTAESLSVTAEILKREIKAKTASYSLAVSFLQSCQVALESHNADLQQRVAREWCVFGKDIQQLARAEGQQWPTPLVENVSNALKEKYSSCPQCGRPIQAHVCRAKGKRGQ